MQIKIGSGNACRQRLLKTPQDRTDPSCEFASPKRFGDVIVGPKIQAADSVLFTCTRGKKDDGDTGQVTAFTNLAADFKTTVTGNHNVEQK
jgi:hypothetical protein